MRAVPGTDAVEIRTAVRIAAPPAEVFAFATNAYRWVRWHPATASVRGVPDRPLDSGETVIESIRAGGRAFDATWTVLTSEPPRHWTIATDSAQGAAWIEYIIAPDAQGTHFARTLRFRSHRAPWRWLDGTLARWVLARQSRRALDRLRTIIEQGGHR